MPWFWIAALFTPRAALPGRTPGTPWPCRPSRGGGGSGNLADREITHFGWTIGLGTEWMITPNWTAFVEYNYNEFDKKNYDFPLNLGAGAPGLPSA